MGKNDEIEISPADLDAFERLVSDWLSENRDAIEAGGAGDLPPLAQAVLQWAGKLQPAQQDGGKPQAPL